MSSHQQLVTALAAQATPVKSLMNNNLLALLWLLSSVIYCLAVIHWLAPIRATAFSQLMTEPRFLLEMLLGFAAIVLTTFTAFQQTIPGALRPALKAAASLTVLLWVALNVYGLIDPALEPSTEGSRHYCVYETLIYALPPLFFAGLCARQRFVLKTGSTGFALGLAAGLIPAWYMQIACMYAPDHMLKFHLAPALVVACLGAFFLKLKSATQDPSNSH